MKRSNEDLADERARMRRKYEGSPLSNVASPAWTAPAASPAYRPQPKHVRHFKGCSKITDYEFLDKLGEGTFG
jgi:serine/threonine-protein kinase BUR1